MRTFRVAVIVAATALVALCAATAGAKVYDVSGAQTVVDAEAGTSTMSGGLIGNWSVTAFTQLVTTPVYQAKGTEKFVGCIDVGHDRSCKGDPSGTLRFSFRYWGKFPGDDPEQQPLLGTCAHPVTGGTGAFAGARGFLAMVDTPTAKDGSLETQYQGVIVTKRGAGSSVTRAHRSSAHC